MTITQTEATTELTPVTDTREVPGEHWLSLANETTDPLECIAMALTGMLEIQVRAGAEIAQADDQSALVHQLDQGLADANSTIKGVLDALGKSTSQVAKNVRAVIEGAPAEEPSTEPGNQQGRGQSTRMDEPERDAPLEQWRVYAGQEGFDWTRTEGLNRSQIRTLLGIPNA